ncbi:MAG: GNAT family N-acetyltransferase [Phenylobacterium zucineum]|nr:MAG: GNAT family N-acetyltransferase [Phenylobacterium zucineum]
MQLTHRIARPEDAPALDLVMNAAIAELQKGFLSPEQVESSRMIMGLDRQLLADGTYFVIQAEDGRIAGCGGWSRRATLYGGDHTPGRDAALLDPATDAARVRAMYTHPDFVRRGVGRMILRLCETAAKAEGFGRLELMATLSGRALYSQCGYEDIEAIEDARGGAPVPMVRMGKAIP